MSLEREQREGLEQFCQTLSKPLDFIHKTNFKNEQAIESFFGHVLKSCDVFAAQHPSLASKVKVFKAIVQDSKKPPRDRIAMFEDAIRLLRSDQSEVALETPGPLYMPKDHPKLSEQFLQEKLKTLEKPVQFVKGVGPVLAGKLNKVGIFSLLDLMLYFPRTFEDRRNLKLIKDLLPSNPSVVVAKVKFAGVSYYRGVGKRVFECVAEDHTGSIRLKWFRFNEETLKKKCVRGKNIILFGTPKLYRSKMEMHHPEVETLNEGADYENLGKVIPIYREVSGVHQKTLRKIIHATVLQYADTYTCLIPPQLCQKYNLPSPSESIKTLHQDPHHLAEEKLLAFRRVFVFQELFYYCFGLALERSRVQKKPGIAFYQNTPRRDQMLEQLSFQLTRAQKRALAEIDADMGRETSMNRLLQGDVGSGKTVVAFAAAMRAIDSGYQVAFLAPTEVLAQQHYQKAKKSFDPMQVSTALFTGKMKNKARVEIIEEISSGKAQLIFGTHSLLEQDVSFCRLGLVVIDEQHRFGVRQRKTLLSKGNNPDTLIMSATPIPRTLALTLYGDLDVSIIDEMPKHRKTIETQFFYDQQRSEIYTQIRKAVSAGRQVFIIYPLVVESENMDLKNAVSMHEHFKNEIFGEFQVGLIHGRMKSDEKEQVMGAFAEGSLDILVSTTVIEVGIDIPNASMMVIEHPERFGLSQLHQLRGRVGRGSHQSQCFLVSPRNISQISKQRIRLFVKIHDGFKLAEEDLRLRGPGDFFGYAQKGFPEFSAAEFPRDLDLLETCRKEVALWMSTKADKASDSQQRKAVQSIYKNLYMEKIKLSRVG